MKRTELVLIVACALLVSGSLAVVAMQALQNPMHERLSVLENEMASVEYIPEEYETSSNVNYPRLVALIVNKQSIWKELVAPPKVGKRPPRPPNLEKMLQGVVASRRIQMVIAGSLSIKITTPSNPRGSFMKVGDKLEKLTITEITKDSVTFHLKKNGKDYTHSLDRK